MFRPLIPRRAVYQTSRQLCGGAIPSVNGYGIRSSGGPKRFSIVKPSEQPRRAYSQGKVLRKTFYRPSFITRTMEVNRSQAPLVWIDCEMTGLDPETDHIIQVCCFITDHELNLVEPQGFEAVVHQPKQVLDAMNEWCTTHHGDSGLTAAVLASTTTAEKAAADLLAYVKKYVPQERTGILAGNSVHADRGFLVKGPYKPVMDWLHYRIMDASTIKEAAKRWGSDAMLRALPEKKYAHLAREDILESIEEMRFYKDWLFGGGKR